MDLISRYLIKDLFLTLVFITASLTFAVWLTQILRFLELVVDAGAPAGIFFQLLLMTIPKFLEIVLPIGILASILFVYNRMIADNELIVMRAAGLSQWDLAKPALNLSLAMAAFLFALSGWISPLSHANLQETRQVIKSQYTSTLISEGVFNSFGNGLTVYVDNKLSNGELQGIMIHQQPQDPNKKKSTSKDTNKMDPSTIVAEKGLLVSDGENTRVIVSKGSRQQRDEKTNYVSRLDFNGYTIDITPEKKEVRIRWAEPDERTLVQLMHPDKANATDMKNLGDFRAEIHRRIASPLFLVTLSLLALTFLLAGSFNRRGYSRRIITCLAVAVVLQSLFMTFASLAKDHTLGIVGLYIISIVPSLVFLLILNKGSRTTAYLLGTPEEA